MQPIPEGHVLCTVCDGTGKVPLTAEDKRFSWNKDRTHKECQNCGGQFMYGKGTGYTRVNPKTGKCCVHEYQGTSAGRCCYRYTCIHCSLSFIIDSGD